MHARKIWNDKRIYPKYEPYPVSWDLHGEDYSSKTEDGLKTGSQERTENKTLEDFSDLAGDASFPDWFQSRPITSNDERSFRPLHLLRTLFSDRLDFLHRALEELESSMTEREELTREALEELDMEIRDCDRYLALIQGLLNDPERRRNLERRLFELKRERRREALLSWRDIVWLRGEIRKLRREIEAQERTVGSTVNRNVPT